MSGKICENLISLIRVNFKDEKISFPEKERLEDLLIAAKNHHIFSLIYYGLKKTVNRDEAELMRLLPSVCKNISIDETQRSEIEKIEATFSENGIDYMPLKGAVMKGFYPTSDMRIMTDFDVLIKVSQYKKIVPIMEGFGYSLKVESNHEYVWIKEGALCVELHKMLIPSYNEDYYKHFKEGWDLAKPSEIPHKFKMTDEDFYFYNFVHLCKHYRDGGIGIKHVLDLWILKNALPGLNFEYIQNKAEEIALDKFLNNINQLISVWFEDGEHSDITKVLEERIFVSGAYGTAKAHLYSSVVKKSDASSTFFMRASHIFSMVFPPLGNMKNIFPILKKLPVLLPFFWVYKFLKFIVNPKKISKQMKIVKSINGGGVNSYKNELETIGLSFNFGEEK